MSSFVQLASEVIPYRQSITGDVIQSAEWRVFPPGPEISQTQHTSTTATAFFSSEALGAYKLTVVLSMTSGASFIGEAKIIVAKSRLT